MTELLETDKKFASIRGPWIVGTAALTETQVLAINMFITYSTPHPEETTPQEYTKQ